MSKLNKEKPKMLSLRMPEALHTKIKTHAASNKTSVQQWLLKLIQNDLSKKR